MTHAVTAIDAFQRYELFLAEDRLTQGAFHRTEKDGRQLACAMGVIGDDVDSTKKCPAEVMPRWLAQLVPFFFDRQTFDDAKGWGLRFYAELARLNGEVPFSVIHDWRGNVLMPMRITAFEARERETAPLVAVQALHLRALAGETIDRDTWHAALKAMGRALYAYAYADADADAYAYAYAYADAYAYAYAYADALKIEPTAAVKTLADGMVDCLARLKVGAAAGPAGS